MKNLGIVGMVAWILVIVGAVNWGLMGLFKLDLVAMILGDYTLLSRVIYILIGASGILSLYVLVTKKD